MDEGVIEGFKRGVTKHFYLGRAKLREFSFKGSLGYFRDGNGAVSSRIPKFDSFFQIDLENRLNNFLTNFDNQLR